MNRCLRTRLLLRFLPFKSVQYAILQRHLSTCPECRNGLAELEEARKVTIPVQKIGPVKDFWPDVARRLEKAGSRRTLPLRSVWRWALGSAGLALAGLAVVLLMFFPRPHSPELDVKLRIESPKIYDQPAQAFVFQTPDADRTFVWVERTTQGEMP